jgi:Sulfotransferase domain
MAHDFVTVVSGLPRSGTSLMMQMLHAGGLPVLSDGQRAADENNLRGYFEYEPVKRLRSDRSWLPQARGQAVKIIHLLLRELLLDGSLQYRIVFMHRPLAEVLASQQAMLQREGKVGADAAVLKKAFESQLTQLDAWLAAQAGIRVLRVPYHRVVQEPQAVAEELNRFLGLQLDTAAMVQAVDPALHRQRGASA